MKGQTQVFLTLKRKKDCFHTEVHPLLYLLDNPEGEYLFSFINNTTDTVVSAASSHYNALKKIILDALKTWPIFNVIYVHWWHRVQKTWHQRLYC